jgi:hypothetical protein
MSRVFALVPLLLLALLRCSHAATFQSEGFWGNRVHITMWGQIYDGDDQKFKAEVLKQIRAGKIVSTLNAYSNGGSVDAGLKIGEMVRTLEAVTHAPLRDPNDSSKMICLVGPFDRLRVGTGSPCMCASSCFLIWTAGYDREGDDLEIHDPRFGMDVSNIPVESYQQQYQAVENEIRTYLTKMDIPDWTITKMFDQISSDVYPLKDRELGLLRNRRSWLRELLLARCKDLPDGNYQTNPVRLTYMNCADVIYQAIFRKSAQKFLDVYGNSGETLPETAAALPEVKTSLENPSAPVIPTRPSSSPATPPPVVVPQVTTWVRKIVPDANYVLRENRDLDGSDMEKHPNTTQTDCMEMCERNSTCEGFSFDDWNNFCILKTGLRTTRLDPQSISGIKLQTATSRFGSDRLGAPNFAPLVSDTAHLNYGSKYARYANAYFPGDGYATYPASSLDHCARQICEPSQHCVAFTYFTNSNLCRIFSSTGKYFQGDHSSQIGVKTQELQ